MFFCPNCSAELASENVPNCWNCQADYGADSAWRPVQVAPGKFRKIESKQRPPGSGGSASKARPLTDEQKTLWRLVNLSLGVSAILGYLSFFGLLPIWAPASWLIKPWFSASSLATVPPMSLLLAQVGINLLLPASILMVVFRWAGLHRSRLATEPWFPRVTLTAAWALYLVSLTTISQPSRELGSILAVLAIIAAPVIIGILLLFVIAVAAEMRMLLKGRDLLPPHKPRFLMSMIVLPPLLAVAPLLLAPSNPLRMAARETAEFKALCKDVGIRLMEKPAGPVRSVAYDWDPQRMRGRPDLDHVQYDSKGHILSFGGSAPQDSVERQKMLDMEFTESRRDGGRAGRATINPNATYYHFPNHKTQKPYYGVDELSADVLVFYDVNDLSTFPNKGSPRAGAIRYEITLTDRRSGAVIGVQAFVVDQINKRACGANNGNAISQEAFFYTAFNR